jgi:hypothetical protein
MGKSEGTYNHISCREDGNNRSCQASSKIDEIYEGVEDLPLALPEDKEFTTEFAFYTVLQLKKCYLTKSGGSRGSCPLGYPGLACAHCTGSAGERRFFYTSSDHLRNSFSHIPAHIITCSLCPEEVKTKMETLKCIRNKQKSLLKVGLHKIFIDRVWERLHGPGGGIILNPPDDVDEDDQSIDSFCTDSINTRYNNDLNELALELDSSSSNLVGSLDRNSTTDYTIYSLLQLIPRCSASVFNLLESKDELLMADNEAVAQNLLAEKSTLVSEEHQSVSLCCKYCMISPEAVSFKISSPDDLRTAFPDIPDHLLVCHHVPEGVKNKLRIFKALRAYQESQIKYSTHRDFIKTVWGRLRSLLHATVVSNQSDISGNELVSEKDRDLVSDYTFFTMLQMRPCYLDRTGNGARSMFEHGFPGLACIHCFGTASSRTFFYRTAEILAGNYAHIPNHLLSCRHCPSSLKLDLQEKKRAHMSQKVGLNRGSQRLFFYNIWDRLHSARQY